MQYVNDSCRVVYAYEMPPCPALLEEAKIPPLVLDFPTVEEPNKFSATHTNSGKHTLIQVNVIDFLTMIQKSHKRRVRKKFQYVLNTVDS